MMAIFLSAHEVKISYDLNCDDDYACDKQWDSENGHCTHSND